MLKRPKAKVYRTLIRPGMTYGAETRALKKTDVRKLLITGAVEMGRVYRLERILEMKR